ncbi:VUT family protein [Deinococcus metallilatus]|uniref:VUT family protein n=1 Tax=Deinococcus metallilatus TaxID=1211322 RepID=A0AAJ5F2F7_9DEIO|nr:VUT family protein [Deinococcus metallilatus]RXJ13233.1 VUT family protein [Deinococcus metallilatus]TLK23066.1 VUT family protein [Deinococcus metallilatus]
MIALYAASILLANVTLNQFIQLPGFGLLSVGTIFFAAVFTLRDRIHRAGGLKAVYVAIGTALLVNTVAALLLGTPWRFIGASFLAILLGELADTAVYQRLIEKSWWTRVLTSNAVSVPLDSITFTLLAFYGSMSGRDIAQIIFADILAKYAIAALFAFRVRHAARAAAS